MRGPARKAPSAAATRRGRDEHAVFAAIAALKNAEEAQRFLRDLMTPAEIEAFAERWRIALLLDEGALSYRDIAAETGASTTTVARVARFLKEEPHQGYRMMIDRLRKTSPKRAEK
ncbi:MAG: YerC/YecD family TrpR-related protein [Pseudomonadota bacterium]|nr:YerC/YecD family TrpR-related protein [Pseudomonadota bacterium]